MSLFNTLNVGVSGLFASKTAMNATSQNIANVNNPNYSRREVNMSTSIPVNYGGLELGTGTKIESLQRVRDQFLDIQYRKYNTEHGYWKTINSNLNYIQSLYGEPSEEGFRKTIDEFWGSIHKILSEPTVPENKRELVYKANELANKLNSLYNDIENVKDNMDNDIQSSIDEINSKLDELATLNRQIKELKNQNISPNDLLDKRDVLLDELSEKFNFIVKEKSDGQISIIVKGRELLNGEIYKKLSLKEINGNKHLFVDNGILRLKEGSLGAMFELRDNLLNDQLKRINEFAATFYDTLNLIHEEGFDLTGTIRGMNFFNEIQSGNLANDKLRRIAGSISLSGEPKNYVDSYIKFNQDTISDIKLNFDIGNGELINIENGFVDNGDYIATLNSGDSIDNILTGNKFRGNFNYNYNAQNGGLLTFANEGGASLDNRLIIDFNRNIFKQLGFPSKDIQALKWTDIPTTDTQGIMTFKGPGNYSETLNLQGVTTLNEIANRINTDSDGDGNTDSGLKLVRAFVRNNELYIVPTENAYNDMKNIIIDDPKGMLHEMKSSSVDLSVLDTSQNSLKNAFGLYAYKTKSFDLSDYQLTDNVNITINYKDGTQDINAIQKSLLNGSTIGSSGEFEIVQNGEEFEILPGADGNTYSWDKVDSIEINVNGNAIKIENFYYDKNSAANKLVSQGWAPDNQTAILNLKSDSDLKWRMDLLDFGSFLSIQSKKIEIDFNRDTLSSLAEKINNTNTGVLAFFTPSGRFVLKADQTLNYDLKNAEIKGPERLFELLGLWKHEDNTQPYSENFTFLNPTYSSTTFENKLKYASKFILNENTPIAKEIKVKDFLLNNPDMLAMDLGKMIDSDNDGDIDTIIPSGEHSSTLWEEGYMLKNTKLFSDGRHDFDDYISDMITEVGLTGEKAKRMEINSDSLKTEYFNQRESVKGVSLDEEMANMIKYQQAFNAAAKIINVVDGMLDRIINGLMR